MKYVCTGATLQCTMGTSCPKLIATPKNVSLTGKDQANVADYVSMKNVPSFGRCRSLGYPPTAAATAANHGTLTPMPCVPGTCPKWQVIDKDSLICGEPALLEPATLKCVYGGTISIVNPRQSLEIKVRGVSFSQKSETQQEETAQEIPEELLQEFNTLDRDGLTQQSFLDGVQMALDVAGMAPGVGAIPDLMNAAISVMRGDWVGAGLSIVAAVPGVGDVVGGAKIAYRAAKSAKTIDKARQLQIAKKTKKYIGKNISEDELLSKGICKSDEEVKYFKEILRDKRKEVAFHFYKENGMTDEMKILEHINGIDLNKPVRIREMPPKGKIITIYRFMERGKDGSVKAGPYFTDNINNTTDELGIVDTYGENGMFIKEKFEFVLKEPPIRCLESTAAPIKAPIDGDWGNMNPLNWKQTYGGGTQFYIPLEQQRRRRLLKTARKI